MRTIEWKGDSVIIIDQSQLPGRTRFLKIESCSEIEEAIRSMKIRGAPLLGAAAAYGLALAALHSKAEDGMRLMEQLGISADNLRKTRPTAVNLFWAIDRIMEKVEQAAANVEVLKKTVVEEANRIADEDVEVNRRIGKHGSAILDDGDTVLTHCNAGALATVDYGTALGVIRAACAAGKRLRVIATETRPLLQGARLTAYELKREKIPVTLITDSMVGYAMAKGLIDKVIVGADRIVKDAVANKIGTYGIAILARKHKIPFYVAAPKSTFDPSRKARDVTIEERSIEEVVTCGGVRITPEGIPAINPAFDLTPLDYVTGIICEEGILAPSNFPDLEWHAQTSLRRPR